MHLVLVFSLKLQFSAMCGRIREVFCVEKRGRCQSSSLFCAEVKLDVVEKPQEGQKIEINTGTACRAIEWKTIEQKKL